MASEDGFALGSGFWGPMALGGGVAEALSYSAVAIGLSALAGLIWKIPAIPAERDSTERGLDDLGVRLDATDRSGPIQIEVEYCVDNGAARDFIG